MRYILLTEKVWHKQLYQRLSQRKGEEWKLIDKKVDFSEENLKDFQPEKIFIPHWSYLIPENIYKNYECVVFHMTDLPFGRGGSPLQNLVVLGIQETKISALKVEGGIDTGEIYLKKPFSLLGTAEEIFIRSSSEIGAMIGEIIDNKIIPNPQEGSPVRFKRRKPEEGDLEELSELVKVFDQIRMLDAEGYPHAFIETEHFRFEFTRASLKADESIVADVRITKK